MNVKQTAILLFILLNIFAFALTISSRGEIVNYENISTSQYKMLKISSDLCTKVITDCKNEVYINGQFAGLFKDAELIEVPDGSNITVLLDDPINTNLETTADTGKSNLIIAIMYFIQPIVTVLFIFILCMLTLRWYRRRGRR